METGSLRCWPGALVMVVREPKITLVCSNGTETPVVRKGLTMTLGKYAEDSMWDVEPQIRLRTVCPCCGAYGSCNLVGIDDKFVIPITPPPELPVLEEDLELYV